MKKIEKAIDNIYCIIEYNNSQISELQGRALILREENNQHYNDIARIRSLETKPSISICNIPDVFNISDVFGKEKNLTQIQTTNKNKNNFT